MKITKDYLRNLIKESLYEVENEIGDASAGTPPGTGGGVPSKVLFPMLKNVRRAEQELRRVNQTISYMLNSTSPGETVQIPTALMTQLKNAEEKVASANAELNNLFNNKHSNNQELEESGGITESVEGITDVVAGGAILIGMIIGGNMLYRFAKMKTEQIANALDSLVLKAKGEEAKKAIAAAVEVVKNNSHDEDLMNAIRGAKVKALQAKLEELSGEDVSMQTALAVSNNKSLKRGAFKK